MAETNNSMEVQKNESSYVEQDTVTHANGITEGVIWKQILLFFFPILIGTFFQQLYNTVDAVVVGRFAGKEALSCVSGSSAQILNFVVGFFTGLSAGATVIIAQFYGAKNRERLDQALHTAYAFAVTGGILFGAAGFAFAPFLLQKMNTPQELMNDSLLYVRIYFAGLIFVFVYNIGSAVLRAAGDAKRPLYYLIICCLVNIVLDLTFVLALHQGVRGVAVATLISQAISAVLVTRALMVATPGMKLVISRIHFQWELLGRILQIGIPSAIQSSMYSISNMIIQASLNRFGVNTVAAWGAFGKVDSLVWMVLGAFGIAITTFVGQNFGARKWDRIGKGVRVTLLMSLVTTGLLSVLILTFGQILLGIFTTDGEVVSNGVRMMSVISPTYALFTFVQIYAGALQAEGHVLVPTLITMGGTCLFRIVWVLLIVPNGTLEQIIFCYPLTWAICALLFILYYTWKQRKIIQSASAACAE